MNKKEKGNGEISGKSMRSRARVKLQILIDLKFNPLLTKPFL